MPASAARRGAATALAGVLLLLAGGCSHHGSSDDADVIGSGAPSSTTTSIRFTGPADAGFCAVLKDLGSDTALDQPSESPADAEAAFTHVLDVLRRAADAAPPELRQDTALLEEGMADLDDALRAVGYDYDALASTPQGPEVSSAVNDPAFTVAGDRIQAYKHQLCHL